MKAKNLVHLHKASWVCGEAAGQKAREAGSEGKRRARRGPDATLFWGMRCNLVIPMETHDTSGNLAIVSAAMPMLAVFCGDLCICVCICAWICSGRGGGQKTSPAVMEFCSASRQRRDREKPLAGDKSLCTSYGLWEFRKTCSKNVRQITD